MEGAKKTIHFSLRYAILFNVCLFGRKGGCSLVSPRAPNAMNSKLATEICKHQKAGARIKLKKNDNIKLSLPKINSFHAIRR